MDQSDDYSGSGPVSREEIVHRIVDDIRKTLEAGDPVDLEVICRAHPDAADEIRDLFPVIEGLAAIRPSSVQDASAHGGDGLPSLEQCVLGDYRLKREIGRGGMGIVYEAVQTSLDRKVALKVLPHYALLDPQRIERFQREAQAAARLQHPNMVPVFEVGEERGIHFYAMEFINGQPLSEVLQELRKLRKRASAAGEATRQRPGGLSEEVALAMMKEKLRSDSSTRQGPSPSSAEPGSGSDRTPSRFFRHYCRNVADLGAQVAEAIFYAHSQGILHRDIKPSNLLLDARGTVWVTDFGLAKAMGMEGLTQSGDVVGTINYMAPERFQGTSDTRSDIYSLGVTLYELLTLRQAFREDDRGLLMRKILGEKPPAPCTLDRRVPDDLETIILKAMDKDPENRYQSAAELAQDLRHFASGEPISARRPTLIYLFKLYVRRNRIAFAAAAAVFLVLVGVLAGWIVSLRSAWKVADAHLTQVLRLSDVKLLGDYEAAAENFWPCIPEQVSDMEGWVGKAEKLVKRLPLHEATLEALRKRALPYSEADAAKDRESHPKAGELKQLRKRIVSMSEEMAAFKERLGNQGKATLLDFGKDPANKPIAYQFRHAFSIEASGKTPAAKLRIKMDTGAAVYLNGAEICRFNMPEGAVTDGMRAISQAKNPMEHEFDVPAGTFKEGRNLLAVDVRQWVSHSAHMYFSLELEVDGKKRVPSDAVWRFPEQGGEVGEGWRELDFDDSAWPSGPSPMGYGFKKDWGWGVVLELEMDIETLKRHALTLEEEVAVQKTWRFEATPDQWRHDVLAQLVSGLQVFQDADNGVLADVKKRLDFSKNIRRRSITDPAAAWERAIASIANEKECPAYGGLKLVPQLGLVPIHRNDDTGLWEFAHLQTGDVPKSDEKGRLILTDATGLVFVLIPGGIFNMGAVRPSEEKPAGSPNVDPFCEKIENPIHPITLAPFFLSKYEMTQGQWLRFTGVNPSVYGPNRHFGDKQHTLLHPVESVSWEVCHGVLRKLGLMFPTEAQWEYAARAGTTTVWWVGDDMHAITGTANLADSFAKKNGGHPSWEYDDWLDDGYLAHAPVGSYAANGFGLHDTIGNVWELCLDLNGSYRYHVEADTGERKVFNEAHKVRICRGGGWSYTAKYARSAMRSPCPQATHNYETGIRPCLVVEP